MTTADKSQMMPRDRVTRRVTPIAGCWGWSTGDGCRSTVTNTQRRSTCRRKLLPEFASKFQKELQLF